MTTGAGHASLTKWYGLLLYGCTIWRSVDSRMDGSFSTEGNIRIFVPSLPTRLLIGAV